MNYPNSYPNELVQLWILEADSGIYRVSFNDFSLEEDADYLIVGLVGQPGHFKVDDFTGSGIPDDLVLFSSRIWILFISDYEVGGRGFNIDVTRLGKKDYFALLLFFVYVLFCLFVFETVFCTG